MLKNWEMSDKPVSVLVQQSQGLVYQGTVTTYTDSTHFACTGLSGLGDDFFASADYADWEIYALWDKGGAGAASQGLMARCNDYTSSSGTFTHTAFASGTLAVGDKVLLVHPILAWLGTKADAAAAGAVTTADFLSAYMKQVLNELLGTDGGWTNMTNGAVASLDVALQKLAAVIGIDSANTFAPDIAGSAAATIEAALQALDEHLEAVQGGSETLESLDDELDAMIDMAKTPDTTTITAIGTEETLTALTTTNTNPMFIAGVWLGLENLAAGDMVKFRIYADWDDASIADVISADDVWVFGGVQTPKWAYIPINRWITYEIRVAVNQYAGTARAFNTVLDIGQRGS